MVLVETEKERETHHHGPLHLTHEHGMAAAGSYSHSQLRAGKLHQGWCSLIEKGCNEKTWGT